MLPVIAQLAENVVNHQQLVIPLLFGIVASVANVYEPTQHSLLITSVSWLLVCIPSIIRAGLYAGSSSKRRKLGWFAGALLCLSQICDRVTLDKQGTWTTKPLLPLLVVLMFQDNHLSMYIPLPTSIASERPATESKSSPEEPTHSRSYRLLVAVTASAAAVLAIYTTSSTFALGISSVTFAAAGLVLLGLLVSNTVEDSEDNAHASVFTNGTSPHVDFTSMAWRTHQLAALRDVAVSLTLICGIASYLIEPSVTETNISWNPVYAGYSMDWREVHNHRILLQVLWSIPMRSVLNGLIYLLLQQHGVVNTSLSILSSFVLSKVYLAFSLFNFCSTVIFGSLAMFLFGSSASNSLSDMRSSLRIRRIMFGVTVLAIALLIIQHAHGVQRRYSTRVDVIDPYPSPNSPLGPVPLDLTKGHPAAQLLDAAEANFHNTLNRQSKTFADAVREYRRRYGIAPPPNFDKWYELATRNGVVMIDEFDMINEMLLPFWALKPVTIRSRIANALGHEDTALIAIAIRHGAVENFENGEEWQRQATIGMLKEFVQYLPDMDLGFNMYDEPRVVVPNNLLSAMIAKARDEVLPRAAGSSSPRNAFSARPSDMNDGTRFIETSTTSFSRFAHQSTWTHSRLSCPANTQAQTFEDTAADNLTAYAASPLNYIYNLTAFSDICNSPSLSSSFGFFERPNAFNIIHELTPVFSQSKISSFQDILYPSPWYWAGKVSYDGTDDTTWENKTNSLYWRGSTTGGFSRAGGWRRQHRQHIVQRINAPDKAQVLNPISESTDADSASTPYSVEEIDRRSLKHLINVRFSHIGQCDPGDCDAQKEFFKVTDRVEPSNAWYYKHLLDMDGNAFSGRFYSFLKSKSLTYKMAVFREWHADWLKPWVHYIPLSLKGDEHLDLVKWLSGDSDSEDNEENTKKEKVADKGGNGDSLGERKAREIAQRSTEWHDKVLRNVDFEVWLFRLLLEYGRVIDDNREEIGYPGP